MYLTKNNCLESLAGISYKTVTARLSQAPSFTRQLMMIFVIHIYLAIAYYSLTIFDFLRYFVICFPLKSKKFNSTGNIKTALIIIWTSSFLLSIPMLKLTMVSVWNFLIIISVIQR